jgi:hypothetical protein
MSTEATSPLSRSTFPLKRRCTRAQLSRLTCPQNLSPGATHSSHPVTELPDLLEPSQFRGGRAGRRCIDTLLAKEVLRPAAQESHLQALFAGATTSGSWSRGTMEVLRGALSDNKNPDLRGFFLCQSPLTDSYRRPPPYHGGFDHAAIGARRALATPALPAIWRLHSPSAPSFEEP